MLNMITKHAYFYIKDWIALIYYYRLLYTYIDPCLGSYVIS